MYEYESHYSSYRIVNKPLTVHVVPALFVWPHSISPYSALFPFLSFLSFISFILLNSMCSIHFKFFTMPSERYTQINRHRTCRVFIFSFCYCCCSFVIFNTHIRKWYFYTQLLVSIKSALRREARSQNLRIRIGEFFFLILILSKNFLSDFPFLCFLFCFGRVLWAIRVN